MSPGHSAITVTVPIALPAITNRREHHFTRARRVRREIAAVLEALRGKTPPTLPVTVAIRRSGWMLQDNDNLVSACKSVRDAIANWLGVDDRDNGLHWRLDQEITRERRCERRRGTLKMVEVVDAKVTITVRPWTPRDGRCALRVSAKKEN